MRIILLILVYPLQYLVISFVQGIGQLIQTLAEVFRNAMLQGLQLAEHPSEPVQQSENLRLALNTMSLSHSICSFRQCLDHKILIIHTPTPHRHAWGQVHRTANVLNDVHFLSGFIM